MNVFYSVLKKYILAMLETRTILKIFIILVILIIPFFVSTNNRLHMIKSFNYRLEMLEQSVQSMEFNNLNSPSIELNYSHIYTSSDIPKQSEVHLKNTKTKRLPQAIVIGVMKCGTFAIKAMMDMHSKLVSPEKEVNYFTWKYEKGLMWYLSKMPKSYRDQVTLEKSPNYFKLPNVEVPLRILHPLETSTNVPLRIHNMNSSIKLILIVRDPVIRSISQYTHNKIHGRYMEDENFRDLVLDSDGEVNRTENVIANSLYVLPLVKYLEVFPLKQILVLNGDQLISDPLSVVKKVEKYLGLNPEITKENIYFDEDRGFYCIQQNGKKECIDPSKKGLKHPDVDEDVVRKLRAFYAPYNQKFYDLVGEDFGWPIS